MYTWCTDYRKFTVGQASHVKKSCPTWVQWYETVRTNGPKMLNSAGARPGLAWERGQLVLMQSRTMAPAVAPKIFHQHSSSIQYLPTYTIPAPIPHVVPSRLFR